MNPRLLIVLLALLTVGCNTLPLAERQRVGDIVRDAHAKALSERAADAACEANTCPVASPLLDQAQRLRDTSDQERHHLHLLDYGQDSLLARVHLIRAAKHTIELQTFIFDDDDSGRLTLTELRAAARRGVKVRLLLDQLYGLPDPNLQAALAMDHPNLELRLYNPTFGEARTQDLEFAAGILCCFTRFNQRMHSKLLLVDESIGVLGGRNVQDRYFDWSALYNYRDRDVLLSGPAAAALKANFEAFWADPKSVPSALLRDVQQRVLRLAGASSGRKLPTRADLSTRAQAVAAQADDGKAVAAKLATYAHEVGAVRFYADVPNKHADSGDAHSTASKAMADLVQGAQHEVLLQTPYLVFSREARRLFRGMHRRATPPRVRVSTNSLAATDAFPVYAMSHKYKRMYLHDLGFRIYEFKPFPASAALDVEAMRSGSDAQGERLRVLGSGSSGSRGGVVPLKHAGIRVGLHAKSLVLDGRVGVVGSHNFDPRSDRLNTESMLVVDDVGFAQALQASIESDMRPENAWVVAPKPRRRFIGQLSYNLDKLSEKLPVFDLWPFSYASSYELKPGCSPILPGAPGFHECHENVGDFPEVDLPSKSIYTSLLKVFGAGLVPIL